MKNPNSSYSYVKKYAQELNDEVIKKHIDLYVNNFTADLGDEGKNAVETLFKMAKKEKLIVSLPEDIFVIKKK